VGTHVTRALDYLHHEQRLLHGDMKSANVLVYGGNFDVVKVVYRIRQMYIK
jgi:Ser/Thr protein kinase RdoA (MazF antagonist)